MISSALHIFPAVDDGDPETGDGNGNYVVTAFHQIHQCMVSWMVSGDMEWCEAVYTAAAESEDDKIAHTAANALYYHAERSEEIKKWLEAQAPEERAATAGEYDAQVRQLAVALAESPDWHRIAFVVVEDHTLVIGTMDGQDIDKLPIAVGDLPVITRKALPKEVKAYQQWRDRMEDPV
jgi:hypothetical protein